MASTTILKVGSFERKVNGQQTAVNGKRTVHRPLLTPLTVDR
jgi:uncharacterized Zn-binding protein involved in type VI secretion